jgi:radical S-adenosyl methionine domain-containing protein 2
MSKNQVNIDPMAQIGMSVFIFGAVIVAHKVLKNITKKTLSINVEVPGPIEHVEIKKETKRVAVNYHITRQCNYNCGFCFHTAKTSHVLEEADAKKVVKELRAAGFSKINFAGGEPFMKPKLLGKLVKYAKVDCGFESVSIISNGSKIQNTWFDDYSEYLDILGISCDSIEEEINIKIGRGKGNHLVFVKQVARWCQQYNVMFKLNTVANHFNIHTDMSAFINELSPMRWKVFQVLPLEGENTGNDSIRDVRPFLVDQSEFTEFVARNQRGLNDPSILKVEGNDVMQSSYILVDEYGCFLDSSTGGKTQTRSILEVGVDRAWQELLSSAGGGYDHHSFEARDGAYKTSCWSKGSATADIEDLHM